MSSLNDKPYSTLLQEFLLDARRPRKMLLARACDIAREFNLRAGDVARVSTDILQELKTGLRCNGPTQMPSFVTTVPNGSETGSYLVVDLGGTNCRICMVHLQGRSRFTMEQTKHLIPRNVRVNASYKPLFDFIAKLIRDFLAETYCAGNGNKDTLRLGFTFSFTYIGHSLSQGAIVQWDKGWDLPDALGKDPCLLLQQAMDHLDLDVRVTALTNDSVGTLMARAYTSPWPSDTLVGAIFGTGTNAAYIERRSNITRLERVTPSAHSDHDDIMILNTEWGAMCDSSNSSLPRSRYDHILDIESSNPGGQLLEKQISGLYLGELMRLATVSLLDTGLTNMTVPHNSPLFSQYTIDTSFLSKILEDSKGSALQEISVTLQAKSVTDEDVRALQQIATAVVKRSARLSSAAIAAIIVQSGRLEIQEDYDMPLGMKPKAMPVTKEIVAPSGSKNHFVSKIWSKVMAVVRRASFCFKRSENPRGTPAEKAGRLKGDNVGEISQIIDIGVDGSVYERCPDFEKYLREALREIPSIGYEGEACIRLGLSKDGSGVGAALVAHTAV